MSNLSLKRKRPFDASSSASPPLKRLHFSTAQSSSPVASTVVAAAGPPCTPMHTSRYHPVISDSPTNPFGRTRALNPALPGPTSFSKHLALRFQLVRDRGRGRGGDRNGVYRIVQVPLSYDFRLLHRLLYFLFDGPDSTPGFPERKSSMREEDEEDLERIPRTRRVMGKNEKGRESGKRKRRDDKEGVMMGSGHLFEAKRDITLHRMTYRMGQIKTSQTWAKLSSVRDPYRYRETAVTNDDGADVFDAPLPVVEMTDVGEEEGQEWRWEGEEDLKLANVWPEGPDLDRGIVYHHDARTQVHITVNTMDLPRRKGSSNEPYVFNARGDVSLGCAGVTAAARMSTGPWNAPKAFETFLKRCRRETTSIDVEADAVDPMEDVGNMSSTSLASMSLQTPGLSTSSSAASTPYSDAIHTPITPGPTHPLQRLRLDHAQKRLTRLTKKGIEELEEFESESEVEEEVDELAEDDDIVNVDVGVEEGLEGVTNCVIDDEDEETDSETEVAEWMVKGAKKSWRQVLGNWTWNDSCGDGKIFCG